MALLTRRFRPGAALAVLAVSACVCGCATTVDGSAVRAEVPSPQVQSLLDARDLDRILLGDDELNEFMSSTQIEITKDLHRTTDDSASVSEPACLGAVYTAEEPIYKDTGYTAVHTRLAREPDEYGFTVEQTGVILPSVEAAEKFVDDSAQAWSDCAAMELSVTDGQEWHDWDLQDVVRDRGIVSQPSKWAESTGWHCQHSIAAAGNAIVEATVCGVRIRDDAKSMVLEMIAKAADK